MAKFGMCWIKCETVCVYIFGVNKMKNKPSEPNNVEVNSEIEITILNLLGNDTTKISFYHETITLYLQTTLTQTTKPYCEFVCVCFIQVRLSHWVTWNADKNSQLYSSMIMAETNKFTTHQCAIEFTNKHTHTHTSTVNQFHQKQSKSNEIISSVNDELQNSIFRTVINKI